MIESPGTAAPDGGVSADRQGRVWPRIGAGFALAGALVAGAACAPGNSTSAESANPMVTTQGPDSTVRPLLPALEGPLTNTIIIATVAGDETSRGYDANNTVQLAQAAQDRLVEATAGELEFTKPVFLGEVAISMPNAVGRCELGQDLTFDTDFSTAFRAAVMSEAIGLGYDDNNQHNLGLTIFTDYDCADRIRSNVNSPTFSPKNSVLFTEDRDSDARLARVLTHEWGHLLGGLDHSDLYLCQGLPRISSVEKNCQDRFEYRDARTSMGFGGLYDPNSVTRFNGYQLYRMGVVEEDQIIKIESPGRHDIDLSALQPGQGSPQLVRIPRAVEPGYHDTQKQDYYWIELSPGCPEEDCPLSVAIYTADNGNQLEPTNTTLIPLDTDKKVTDQTYGGVVSVNAGGEQVFADTATGLTLTIQRIANAGNGAGSAKLIVDLAK